LAGDIRGGLTNKIHLAVEGRGLPMSITLTPGQAGDSLQLLPLMHQYRDEQGEWRAVVRYATGIMEDRAKACSFTELRPVEEIADG
jgi:hypothetical protein